MEAEAEVEGGTQANLGALALREERWADARVEVPHLQTDEFAFPEVRAPCLWRLLTSFRTRVDVHTA